jgi:hypothetical protein
MANYVLLYKGGRPASDEEGAAVMAAWMAWMGGLGTALVVPGNPFGPSTGLAPDGTVSDHAPSDMTGYSVVSADSLAAATALAKGCPQLASGGTVEVYEAFEIM